MNDVSPIRAMQIGEPLFEELRRLLLRGESVVLLGSRHVGKRYVLRRLQKGIEACGEPVPLWIEFRHGSGSFPESEVRQIISSAMGLARADADGEFLSPLLKRANAEARRLTVFLSNVDALAHTQARRLLKELQEAVKQRQVVAALTGESDLGELVHGPDSEFNCTHRFLLQGFSQAEFLAVLRKRPQITCYLPDDHEAVLQSLYDLTQGSLHLARALLKRWLARRAWGDRDGIDLPQTEDFARFINNSQTVCEADDFQQAVCLVERSQEAWRALTELVAGRPQSLGEEAIVQPHPLELAGLALRRDGYLQLASPLVKRFVAAHYDERRLGDLAAIHGEWQQAFQHYGHPSAAPVVRPGRVEDNLHLSLAVEALCAALHTEATRGEQTLEKLDRVKELFRQGCRLLLGFPEVSFWTMATDANHTEWILLDTTLPNPSSEAVTRRALETVNTFKDGVQALPEPWARSSAVVVLPSIRPDRRDVALIGDFTTGEVVPRQRRDLRDRLLGHFTDAYSHAIAVVGVSLRLEHREQHLKIATEIFQELGGQVLEPLAVFEIAGAELLKLDYRRVMFSLVDPAIRRILGALDCYQPNPNEETPGPNVALATDFPLATKEEEITDLQQWVVLHREPHAVADCKRDPLANHPLCEEAGMKGFAVLPMLDPNEEAVGSIHFERVDGVVPSKDEIKDLMAFGRQLAVAVAQAERVNKLEIAVNETRRPVMIFGRGRELLYANQATEQAFGFAKGWRTNSAKDWSRPVHPPSEFSKLPEQLKRFVEMCFETGSRNVHHLDDLQPVFSNPVAITCEPVPDNRPPTHPNSSKVAGVSVHVRDLNYIYRVFEALQSVANNSKDSDSVIDATLEAVKQLGHSRARLWLLDPTGDCLFSKRAIGLEQDEVAKAFANGEYKLPKGRDHVWHALQHKAPFVFHWPEKWNGQERFFTENGLEVINVAEPQLLQVWKRRGGFWLDLPLFGREGEIIGKLTLDCDPTLRPDDFELLNLCSALLGALIDALRRKDESERQNWVREAAEKAIAATAHNLKTHLAGLDGLETVLNDYAMRDPVLAEVKDILSTTLADCSAVMKRNCDMFVGFKLELRPTQLIPWLAEVLRRRLPPEQWSVEGDETLANIDGGRLATALLEMLQNTIELAEPSRPPSVCVQVERAITADRSGVRIIYRDDGPGIPVEIKPRIFEAFFTHRPDKTPGLGLGLHYAWRVIQAHGGRIYERGVEGRGVEFVIELPTQSLP